MAKSDYTTLLNLPGSVSFFAITAMRDLMLPNMLGEEQHHIPCRGICLTTAIHPGWSGNFVAT